MSSIDIYAVLDKFQRGAHPSVVHAIDAIVAHLRAAEQTGYLGTLYRTDFEVEGVGAFPVDMLRYTSSWPKDETDARAVEDSFDQPGIAAHRTITLSKYHRDPEPVLSGDRWASKFRWRVVRVVETVAI